MGRPWYWLQAQNRTDEEIKTYTAIVKHRYKLNVFVLVTCVFSKYNRASELIAMITVST